MGVCHAHVSALWSPKAIYECSPTASHSPKGDSRTPWICPSPSGTVGFVGFWQSAGEQHVPTRCLYLRAMGSALLAEANPQSHGPRLLDGPPQSESLPSCFADPTADASSSSCPFNRSPAKEKQQWLSDKAAVPGNLHSGGPELPPLSPQTILPCCASQACVRPWGSYLGQTASQTLLGRGSSSTSPSLTQQQGTELPIRIL